MIRAAFGLAIAIAVVSINVSWLVAHRAPVEGGAVSDVCSRGAVAVVDSGSIRNNGSSVGSHSSTEREYPGERTDEQTVAARSAARSFAHP